jgi:hypothetical protein
LSDVVALQDDEDAAWAREQGQIAAGVITVGEWRADHGMDPLPAVEAPPAEEELAEDAPLADGEAVRALCVVVERMQESVLDKLGEAARRGDYAHGSIFDEARWRVAVVTAVERELGGGVRAITEAQRVSATVVPAIGAALRGALVEGRATGDSDASLAARAEAVFSEWRALLTLEAISHALP